MSLFERESAPARPAPAGSAGPAVDVEQPKRLLVVEEPKKSLDLDQLQEVVTALGGFVLYLVGTTGGAFALGAAFAPWVGFLLLLVAGLIPSAYALRKGAERRAEKERAQRYAESQERTAAAGAVTIPTFP